MKGKWSPGKITAVVIGSIAGGMFLLAVFYISVVQITMGTRYLKLVREVRERADRRSAEDEENNNRYDNRKGDDEPDSGEDSSNGDFMPYGEEDFAEEEEADQDPDYYTFHNALRDDLSYQIEFEEYVDLFGTDNVLVSMNYPVVSGGSLENAESVNRAISRELEEVTEYVESLVGEVGEENSFFFEGECYVTYMDEEILSLAYVEYGYLDGEFYESYVVSVNIDMQIGMELTNSQMLNIDDDFSVDFRKRSERQNGEISSLYNFTDQEITGLLTDEDSLIIFYTPLGMEVGFNYYYGEGWITVTYKDYEKYRRHF